MAKFRLTITEIETGEVHADEEIDCLIGGIGYDAGKSAVMVITKCDAFALAGADASAHRAIRRIESDHPEVKLLSELALKDEEGDDDDE